MSLGSLLGGSAPKVKSGWQTTPDAIKNLVEANAKGLTGISKDAKNQYAADKAAGYQEYGGDRVAGFADPEQHGLDALYGMPGAQAGIEGQINELGGIDQTLAGDPSSIQALYNPYHSGVIDTTMSDLDRLNQMEQIRRNAAAGGAGSFGGSRAGVMDALALGEQQRSNAAVLGGMRKEGWDTAAGLASKDKDRSSQYGMNYMDTLRGLYGDKGQQTLGMSSALEGIGATQRGIDQSQLDVDYGDFQAEQNYPWMNMQRAQGVLGATNPATDAAAQAGTTKAGTPGLLNTVVGAAASGAGAFMMCDVRLKRDLERVGTLPSGAGLWSFAYVWDDPGTRRVGPVAQDLARFVPEAVVADASGYLMIELGLVR
jgi:hypothetical protein